jgi:hypothetical protein
MKGVLCEESVRGKLVVNYCTVNNATERGFSFNFYVLAMKFHRVFTMNIKRKIK